MRANSRSSARTGLLGVVLVVALALLALPADASAMLSLGEPTSGALTSATPTFSGGTDDARDPVTVLVYAGASVVGEPALTLEAVPSFTGSWRVNTAPSPPLVAGLYTVIAEQTEPLIEGEGPGLRSSSPPVSFEVDTEPPIVTLAAPPPLSNETSPTFSGTASEDTEVIVHVFLDNEQIAAATAIASAGHWSATNVTPALPPGRHLFKAYAREKSALGNEEGQSETVSFEVETAPPTVTLSAPATPSNDRSPSFSGTASEDTEVVVHVLLGSDPVATATATASDGSWSSSEVTPALPPGRHVFNAYATERSGLGNEEGRSEETVSFEVNTTAPEVTIESPLRVSHERTPAFSGTASEAGSVKVLLYKGAVPEGTPIKELTATVAEGRWSSAHVNPALGNGTYSAYSTEPSRLGNGEGRSPTVVFEVSTEAPTVTLTPPPARSNDTTPSFEGTVVQPDSETKPVTVYIHEGSSDGGRILATLQAPVVHERWESAGVSPPLPVGEHTYTAVATTPSTIGNATGVSAPATFTVDTQPPTVLLNQPATPSSVTKPTFSGTASEAGAVTVSVYQGSAVKGTPVAEVRANQAAGTWTSAAVGFPLADGEYTAVARQASTIGNLPGESLPGSFTIDTKAPVVTLKALPTPSPDRAPSFSGTADSQTPVTVDIYRGAKAEGTIVASSTAEASGGQWVTGRLEDQLPFGEYTAVAVQPSPIGNPSGLSATITFAVEAIAPSAETEAASAVTRSSVALYAAVDPNGGPVSSCNFEFGPTSSYGSQVECGFVSGLAAFPPAAAGAVPVFARVYGLLPSTTYHVRVVAVGEGGTGMGAEVTFTTLEALTFPGTEGPSTGVVEKKGATAVAALFAAQLPPKGSAARIGALLKKGLFKQRFKAPQAGTVTIKWLYRVPAVKGAKKSAQAPLLVASGKLKFASASTATITIRLTKAGRLLLAKPRRIRLQATCSFKALGEAPVSASGTFVLVR